MIAGKIVEPKSKIKFLGLTIRSDLRWSDHVDGICAAVRKAAGRIRFEGRHLGRDERRTLYHAWVGGRIHYNAGVYLPLLNGNEIGRIQTACNSAVRAVLGLPKKGKVDLDGGRKELRIPTVEQLRRYYECMNAWENRETLIGEAMSGRDTRRKGKGEVQTPDQRGQKQHLTGVRAALTWNSLPEAIRTAEDKGTAKRLIKKYVYANL